jgi:predicted RNA binding protein YcfA (HicA-like mRNA interferase family)
MPKLRRLSGDEVIRIFERFGFTVYAQRGSHVKLRRVSSTGEKQTLTIPRHRQLDTGTLQAVFRQAGRYIQADELRPYFYAEE